MNLNLGEIAAYGPDGEKLNPVSVRQSSNYNSLYVATKCIDGNKRTFCHTAAQDKNPWLRIDYGMDVAIGRIVVTNRQDCCKNRAVTLLTNTKCIQKSTR